MTSLREADSLEVARVPVRAVYRGVDLVWSKPSNAIDGLSAGFSNPSTAGSSRPDLIGGWVAERAVSGPPTDVTLKAVSPGVLVTSNSATSSYGIMLAPAVHDPFIPVQEGGEYTFSVDVSQGVGARTWGPRIRWSATPEWNSFSKMPSTEAYEPVPTATGPSKRIHVTGIAPVGAKYASLSLGPSPTGGAVGDACLFSKACFTRGPKTSSYPSPGSAAQNPAINLLTPNQASGEESLAGVAAGPDTVLTQVGGTVSTGYMTGVWRTDLNTAFDIKATSATAKFYCEFKPGDEQTREIIAKAGRQITIVAQVYVFQGTTSVANIRLVGAGGREYVGPDQSVAAGVTTQLRHTFYLDQGETADVERRIEIRGLDPLGNAAHLMIDRIGLWADGYAPWGLPHEPVDGTPVPGGALTISARASSATTSKVPLLLDANIGKSRVFQPVTLVDPQALAETNAIGVSTTLGVEIKFPNYTRGAPPKYLKTSLPMKAADLVIGQKYRIKCINIPSSFTAVWSSSSVTIEDVP